MKEKTFLIIQAIAAFFLWLIFTIMSYSEFGTIGTDCLIWSCMSLILLRIHIMEANLKNKP
jgi:hypothetical protein